MIAQMTTPKRPCSWYEASQLLSIGKPLNELLDSPVPKISWNLSRGLSTSCAHTAVRPVSAKSSFVPSPRASQAVITPESVRNAMSAIAPTVPKNRRTRCRSTIRLRPATAMPTAMANRAVLVCVRISMGMVKQTTMAVTFPRTCPLNHSTTTSPVATAA